MKKDPLTQFANYCQAEANKRGLKMVMVVADDKNTSISGDEHWAKYLNHILSKEAEKASNIVKGQSMQGMQAPEQVK